MDVTTWKAIEVSSKIMTSHGTWVGLFTLALGLFAGNGWQLRIQERLKSSFRKELFGKMETGKQINDALDGLLIDLDCERATVFQYHNGNQNAVGVHFDRCSNTHERVQVGASPLMTTLQSLPNSFFASWNTEMMTMKEIHCPELETLRETDFGLYQFLAEQGVRSFYLVGIFSFDGDPVGFVGIHYCRQTRDLTQEELDRLRATSLKICGLVLAGKGDA